MKVCGFSIVKNASKYYYPVRESIESVLPLCDEFVIAVGDCDSDDTTKQIIASIGSPKIRIIDTVWDMSLRKGGAVLAQETNKAFDAIAKDFDWCIYIQADEVLHEDYYPEIRSAMEKHLNNPKVEGLLFKYRHFWGTYNFIGVNRQWYRNEIRIIRNDKQIRSYRDAQGFRKNNQKLHVVPINAYVHHYGWVRPPELMKAKMKAFSAMYRTDEEMKQRIAQINAFEYDQIDAAKRYTGTHPAVMQQRINNIKWDANIDESQIKMKFKDRVLYLFENITGYRLFEYKNYIKL